MSKRGVEVYACARLADAPLQKQRQELAHQKHADLAVGSDGAPQQQEDAVISECAFQQKWQHGDLAAVSDEDRQQQEPEVSASSSRS